MTTTIKFRKHYVTNGETKARIRYSIGNRIDGRKCVTLYAKDWSRELKEVFPFSYKNESDSQADYYEQGRVVLFECHPFYDTALQVAQSMLSA